MKSRHDLIIYANGTKSEGKKIEHAERGTRNGTRKRILIYGLNGDTL